MPRGHTKYVMVMLDWKTQLQLMGAACLLVASKLKDTIPITMAPHQNHCPIYIPSYDYNAIAECVWINTYWIHRLPGDRILDISNMWKCESDKPIDKNWSRKYRENIQIHKTAYPPPQPRENKEEFMCGSIQKIYKVDQKCKAHYFVVYTHWIPFVKNSGLSI